MARKQFAVPAEEFSTILKQLADVKAKLSPLHKAEKELGERAKLGFGERDAAAWERELATGEKVTYSKSGRSGITADALNDYLMSAHKFTPTQCAEVVKAATVFTPYYEIRVTQPKEVK
jgi:hypothetical protein